MEKCKELKKYLVRYYLNWNQPEEVEAYSESEASEEVLEMIMDNICFYIETEVEEVEDEEEEVE